MKLRNTAIAVSVIACLAVLPFLVGEDPVDPSRTTRPTPPEADGKLNPVAVHVKQGGADRPEIPELRDPPAHDDEGLDDKGFIALLQERFGPGINHGHTQVKAIEKLMAYLMKMYPDDWQDRMYDFLKVAFPDHADELYAKFQKLLTMNDWLEKNRHELMQMSKLDRRDAMWDKRFEIFGDDAFQIWEVAWKNDQILEKLEEIADSKNTSVAEKVARYVDAIEAAYGEQAKTLMQKRTTELMYTFLSVEAVQEDLRALPPAERREELQTIRRKMGMDEDAIERWNALDAERDADWTRGEQYMREREQIAARYEGEERERQIAKLQEGTFGDQAEVIRSEEQSGYFRFSHDRRYGRE